PCDTVSELRTRKHFWGPSPLRAKNNGRRGVRVPRLLREVMSARRYTVLIADRSSGVMRQLTVSLRATVTGVIAVMALPVLMGLGAKWSSRSEIDQLRSSNSSLPIEN